MARTRTTWTKGNGPPTAWKPGQSGNPGGRFSPLEDIRALAQEHAPAALKALVDALRDKDRAIPAAIAILDRSYGRPPQAIFAHVNGQIAVGGCDIPPRETLEAWLARRQHTLDALDGPRQDHTPGESASPPNGKPVLPGERSPAQQQAAVSAERTAERPGASGGAELSTRSMTPEEERRSREQGKRQGHHRLEAVRARSPQRCRTRPLCRRLSQRCRAARVGRRGRPPGRSAPVAERSALGCNLHPRPRSSPRTDRRPRATARQGPLVPRKRVSAPAGVG